MNENHAKLMPSPEWAAYIQDEVLLPRRRHVQPGRAGGVPHPAADLGFRRDYPDRRGEPDLQCRQGGLDITAELRSAVTGLLSLACVEEQALLAAAVVGPGSGTAHPGYRGGSPDSWAAVPLVAHNNEFKSQQAERIVALRSGRVPPTFGDVDHASPELYRRYSVQSADEVMVGCRRVTAELIDGTWALADEDLLDPPRHPWLNGRLLWLQIVVRGFWHPTGHLGDYYLGHGQPERAIAMQEHALATARYLGAPPAAVGMAGYNLACAQARSGPTDEAARTPAEAIEANPGLRAHASRDPDLAVLREAGQPDFLR